MALYGRKSLPLTVVGLIDECFWLANIKAAFDLDTILAIEQSIVTRRFGGGMLEVHGLVCGSVESIFTPGWIPEDISRLSALLQMLRDLRPVVKRLQDCNIDLIDELVSYCATASPRTGSRTMRACGTSKRFAACSTPHQEVETRMAAPSILTYGHGLR